ncbi:FAD/NAD(P)-binding protein [Desulfobaculum sp. SPO524]|uniref:FAD/NAD(P)-binding protein n=1 Tax=Desulfobaculum sp. SPO524 TaxID=3378071 RepID=UPI003851CBF9
MPDANPYLPDLGTITEIVEETANIKTFRVVLNAPERMKAFTFEPGQVGQLSVFGTGESTFVINSSPTQKDMLQFSVMKAGEVTAALHCLSVGDTVGVRAPLGNFFPYEDMKGKDIVFIGGGIGMAPLRSLIMFMLDNREDYGRITILYGSRSPEDFCYDEDLKDWAAREDVELVQTVDNGSDDWTGHVGLIPNILREMNPSPEGAVAVTCGPPIMIKFTVQALEELGFPPERIITTLERRMKCGVGLCGRCNIGNKFVCVDGPVFSWAELKELPQEM